MTEEMTRISESNDKLWGLCTFFNPANYQNKYSNFLVFAARARRQGLKLMVIEALFDTQKSSLPEGIADAHLVFHSRSVLWQKERLLNIGIDQLPVSCEYVAWLDGDILFARADWISAAQSLLHEKPIVQLFESAWFLPPPASRNGETAQASGWILESRRHSMMSVGNAFATGQLDPILKGSGHPGLGWAARRDFLREVRFYDKLVLGGADSLMAWALFGMHQTDKVRETFATWWSPALFRDVMSWATKLDLVADRNIGYVPGVVYHLWHGNRTNRAYCQRHFLLRENDFDPDEDIRLDPNGCWTWATTKPDLHLGVRRYFYDRKEDQESIQTQEASAVAVSA